MKIIKTKWVCKVKNQTINNNYNYQWKNNFRMKIRTKTSINKNN